MELETIVSIVEVFVFAILIYSYWIFIANNKRSYFKAYDYLLITFLISLTLARVLGVFGKLSEYVDAGISLYPLARDIAGNTILSKQLPWSLLYLSDGNLDLASILLSPLLTHVLLSKFEKEKFITYKEIFKFIFFGFVFFTFISISTYVGDDLLDFSMIDFSQFRILVGLAGGMFSSIFFFFKSNISYSEIQVMRLLSLSSLVIAILAINFFSLYENAEFAILQLIFSGLLILYIFFEIKRREDGEESKDVIQKRRVY